jgi:hypothetical protein
MNCIKNNAMQIKEADHLQADLSRRWVIDDAALQCMV